METERGLIKAPQGVLTRSTVKEYLNRWHLNQSRLLRQPPATRFQAEHSNDCWQFDLSPSDLKHIDKPDWIDPSRGMPTLMLFSVGDDRSGVAYQEYHCVYGEDAESALRFLFSAMAPKADPSFPFQGRPKMIYLDNARWPSAESSKTSCRRWGLNGKHTSPLARMEHAQPPAQRARLNGRSAR